MHEELAIKIIKNDLNVSRETFDRIERYVQLLKVWNTKFNLISHNDINKIWSRHILDCLELIEYIDKEKTIIDFGSGAGLPGVLLSISGCSDVVLIEKDQKKSAFLKLASKLSLNNIKVISKSIEEIKNIKADFITARAFASIEKIISISKPFLKEKTKFFLHKGNKIEYEIIDAQKKYQFRHKLHKSKFDKNSNLLELQL